MGEILAILFKLPQAPYTLAKCYRMRRIRQHSRSQANFAILTKSSLNQRKKWKFKKSYFDTFKWTSGESETTFLFVLTQSQKSMPA